jgi:muramoyltetrapeptide carboxypeptidase
MQSLYFRCTDKDNDSMSKTLISRLQKGDTVGIISTARKVSRAEIEPAIELLKSWKLKVKIGKTIGNEFYQFAGDDDLRIEDFQQMLDDENVKAIWFARGGYGTVRVIDFIDWKKFLKHPRWLCGFSDATVIHSHVQKNFQVPTIHSLMCINVSTASAESLQSLHNLLFEKKSAHSFQKNALNRNGEASGILAGGNLSLIYSLSGTVSDLNCENKILFIEDCDEYLYHLDRMMMQLKRSGKLDMLKGLLVGRFSNMRNLNEENPFAKNTGEQGSYEIISDHVKEYNYPVCFGFPAGHETDNRALLFGREVRLTVGEKCNLIFDEH